MLGSPAGPGGPSQRGLWPLAPAPAPSATSFSAEGLSKYGVYSLFPGGPTFGSALYSHASTIGRFASGHIQQSSGNTFHAAHKVSDSLFSATGYTFGAPTPPPGSPYSPIPVAQLELLAKGFSNNIIIQQPDFPVSPKKIQITERRCDDKCCSIQRSQKNCSCSSPVKKIQEIPTSGCSRTNPIEWTGVNVKKEPGSNPCQVAEITTSMSPVVKVEVTSPTQKNDNILGNSLISSNDSASSAPSMAASATGAVPSAGAVLQCTDERPTGLAAWPMGGAHGQALAAPTLWQYPANVPVEPMVPLPVSTMPPVGYQLVRDSTTGGILLLSTTTGIEPLPQTVVWPSYPQPSSVLLPSLPSMPPPPLQLLSSASSDYLSSTTLQHTQTHSTRLVAVTTDAKRKLPLPLPATTLIKIETDGTIDQTKTLQAVSTIASNTGTVFTTEQTVPPLVTTHVIYQHPTNLILSQTPNPPTEAASCRSQATSPVAACLTPPPDSIHNPEDEPANTSMVQDASNQTDTPICSEDDNTTHYIPDSVVEEKIKELPDMVKVIESESNVIDETLAPSITEVPMEEPNEPVVVTSSSTETEEAPIIEAEKTEEATETPEITPDLSGLELLSNSIVEFESSRNSIEEKPLSSPEAPQDHSVTTSEQATFNRSLSEKAPPITDNLGGLDLLCALAEQRILEENIDKPVKEKSKDRHKNKERRREKRKKKHSSDEPKRKKMKSDKRKSSEERKEHRKKERKESPDKADSDECACKYKHYRTPESELEVKKFLESKSPQTFCCKGDWPCMNPFELDMRMKLAELQREYKEKQKELSKLKPKKHSHHSECSKKKSRKKSTHSDRSSTPPPVLDKMDSPVKEVRETSELLKPPKLSVMPKLEEVHKRRHSETDSSPEKHSSSKKRKVGRPKRLTSSGESIGTETIVAKKPKNNFVGYLLAAKQKLKQQNKECPASTPPRFVEDTYIHKLKKVKNNTIVADDVKSSKIRPKLKAEATLKVEQDECNSAREEEGEDVDDEGIIDHIEEDIDDEFHEDDEDNEQKDIPKKDMVLVKDEPVTLEAKEPVNEEAEEEKPNPCTLTDQHMRMDKLRVLTAMGGLFYAGQLNAIEPPDIYSITLDGERGNRPHILSREEILRDAIVEVAPKSTEELPVGTRLCAYWSQQYRCLYPGSAAEPGTPDPHLDGKFVSVEFDDGDSGKISLQDIRLLPPNYPIVEYDPNPLLSLSKRKRRTSTSVSVEEKQSHVEPVKTPVVTAPVMPHIASTDPVNVHKEKKRQKKKKREKLKKKHKCCDEFCKHKKHHKKHRKHKKHHDKTARSSVSSEDSTIAQPTLEVINEEEDAEVNEESEEEKVVEGTANPENENNDVDNKELEDEEEAGSVIEEEDDFANSEDEATMEEILDITRKNKSKKIRDRQESSESRSMIRAFLPDRQMWHWAGEGLKRRKGKSKYKKCTYYKSIQRGEESINVGDAAVFLSTGRPDRPYIGRIKSMWEDNGSMTVQVKWFYHPEELQNHTLNLKYPGALFESDHVDENDVQTISHKCDVVPLKDYIDRFGEDPTAYEAVYENNDMYYLAGLYKPTTLFLRMENGIPLMEQN
ncbi:BAH domain and coiled-coil containing protein winged eye isoform X2 [Rhynchophorus ferrugineus]|uniref:BAH domain and coiled-coil containing protein winged eye isoform X2 n=1 Tax=Rhynchophorus ferrugineus TaxID=354439 RepID=UPI003FCCBF2E